MGKVFSMFRRPVIDPEDKLAQVSEELAMYHDLKRHHELTERRLFQYFAFLAVFLYGCLISIWFSYISSPTLGQKVQLFAVSVLIIPIIYGLHRMARYVYSKKVAKSTTTITELETARKKLLEDIMENLPYKKVKALLERLAPDQLDQFPAGDPSILVTPQAAGPGGGRGDATPAGRGRGRGKHGNSPDSMLRTPAGRGSPPWNAAPNIGNLPRPVLPQSTGAVDRMLDWLTGDGVTNRYALICSHCHSHNGMALSHEFTRLAFRCCYCNFLNEARETASPNNSMSPIPLVNSTTMEDSERTATPIELAADISDANTNTALDPDTKSRVTTETAGGVEETPSDEISANSDIEDEASKAD